MTCLAYIKHRASAHAGGASGAGFGLVARCGSGAFALFLLLVVICVQPTGAVAAQRAGGGDRGGIPRCHCCHGKVYLKLDKRYDLKPLVVLFLSFSETAVVPVRQVHCGCAVMRHLRAAVFRPASFRGPPLIT